MELQFKNMMLNLDFVTFVNSWPYDKPCVILYYVKYARVRVEYS